jgi:hypothetical protein
MARQKTANSYFLHDETTGDIVGFKDPDGSEAIFARAMRSGAFFDNTDQTDEDTPTLMSFSTATLQNGVTLVDGTNITVDRTAWYSFQLSVHIHNGDNQSHFFDMWGKLNGNDIPSSRFKYSVPSSHGGQDGALGVCQGFYLNLTAGDEVSIVWTTDDADEVTIAKHDAETGDDPKPAAPSLMLVVHEVGYV